MKLETSVGLFILVAIGLFLYLSINIRAIRFDKDQYNTYKAYFDDTSGLALKSPVKIAGVEVGWTEQVELLEDGKAEVMMRINKNIRLAKNAFAMIHQDGLIGTKNLEIDPGDPSTGLLPPGSALSMPGRAPTSVGELLDQFRDIANTIHDIASSFKTVFASRKGEENMRVALNSVTQASQRMADFSLVLQRTMARNEQNINTVVADLRTTMERFKDRIPDAICNNADKFGDASKRAGDAFEHVGDAAIQGRETLREAGEVVEKVNNGKGVIGKLINEDETYTDIKKTVHGFREYVSKTQSLMLNVDMHSESIFRHTNNKGYFELDLRPRSDYFYRLQLVGDEHGSFRRENVHRTWKDDKGNVLHPSQLDIPLQRKVQFAENREYTIQTKNDIFFGLQFGKRFDRLAFRMGVFEGTFGVGLDYYVPLKTDNFHWITTVEAFDFHGTKRWDDTRPHVKWLNKVYFLRNLYTSFGLDDIYCRQGGSPFWGGGLRFGDDDLKYFLSYLPVGKAAGNG